jgi:hypothetical protein
VTALPLAALEHLRLPLVETPGVDPTGLRILLRGWEWYGTPLALSRWTTTVFIYNAPATFPAVMRVEHGAEISPDDILLDLTDAATRDRLVRWLAACLGHTTGCTAPHWGRHRDTWALDRTLFRREDRFDDDPRDPYVPALWAIDITDDRRLPDGSRYVDALALVVAIRFVMSQMV